VFSIHSIPLRKQTNRKWDISIISSIWGSHSSGYEEFWFLGYDSTPCSMLKVLEGTLRSSSGLKNKPSKKQAWSRQQAELHTCYLLYADFLPGLLFTPEDGSDMFLWNIGLLSMDCMTLYLRRQTSSSLKYLKLLEACLSYRMKIKYIFYLLYIMLFAGIGSWNVHHAHVLWFGRKHWT
jgi:hypothetical protein